MRWAMAICRVNESKLGLASMNKPIPTVEIVIRSHGTVSLLAQLLHGIVIGPTVVVMTMVLATMVRETTVPETMVLETMALEIMAARQHVRGRAPTPTMTITVATADCLAVMLLLGSNSLPRLLLEDKRYTDMADTRQMATQRMTTQQMATIKAMVHLQEWARSRLSMAEYPHRPRVMYHLLHRLQEMRRRLLHLITRHRHLRLITRRRHHLRRDCDELLSSWDGSGLSMAHLHCSRFGFD